MELTSLPANDEFLFLMEFEFDPHSAALSGLILGTAAFTDQAFEANPCARAKSSLMSFVNETEYRITPGGFFSNASNFAFRSSIGRF